MLDEQRFSFLLGSLDYLKSAALDVLALILMVNLLIMTPGRNLIVADMSRDGSTKGQGIIVYHYWCKI